MRAELALLTTLVAVVACQAADVADEHASIETRIRQNWGAVVKVYRADAPVFSLHTDAPEFGPIERALSWAFLERVNEKTSAAEMVIMDEHGNPYEFRFLDGMIFLRGCGADGKRDTEDDVYGLSAERREDARRLRQR